MVLSVLTSDFFKVIEGDHDCSDVVERLGIDTIMENFVNYQACRLMQRNSIILRSILYNVLIDVFADNFVLLPVASLCLPCSIHNLEVIKFLKDTITAQNDEVIVALDLEYLYLTSRYNAHWIATISNIFSLNISDGS